MRTAEIIRNTKETQITLELCLDGKGDYEIDTGCGFLDHMLELFARHGRFDLKVKCNGDTKVDYHHTTEDIGIALGTAFKKAVGDGKGIVRYGNFLLPMDETLVLCAVDFSGRAYLGFDVEIPTQKIGDFDSELAEEFFLAFTRNAAITLHFNMMAGKNSHHIVEAIFKGFGRALKQAVSIDRDFADEIPSTKGVL
ncbi:MAG: imidazoleglycerol-phosphate dehydratase HisB [Ruminococcaceae bacterium]|nr:imidazoleglycerol-phosphate dehydratase HisB [Oscillospiraceae bacterium]